jgi:hypothetical protein
MPKKRMETHWDRGDGTNDINPALKRYARYLEEVGLRDSTISSYVFRVGKFLEFGQTDTPQVEDFTRFRETFYGKSSLEVRLITTVSPSRDITSCVGKQSISIS